MSASADANCKPNFDAANTYSYTDADHHTEYNADTAPAPDSESSSHSTASTLMGKSTWSGKVTKLL